MSITARAHAAPADGFTFLGMGLDSGLCESDTDVLAEQVMHTLTNLSNGWGVAISFKTYGEVPTPKNFWCGKRILGSFGFAFLGGQSHPDFQQGFAALAVALKNLTSAQQLVAGKNFYQYFEAVPISTDQYSDGTPFYGAFTRDTYIIRDEQIGSMTQRLKEVLNRTGLDEQADVCIYGWQGSTNSMAAPDGATSISPMALGAPFHFYSARQPGWCDLTDTSYFSESPYIQAGGSWKKRYWGTNYPKLLSVKQDYDPEGVFWCHNCVGSDLSGPAGTAQPGEIVV